MAPRAKRARACIHPAGARAASRRSPPCSTHSPRGGWRLSVAAALQLQGTPRASQQLWTPTRGGTSGSRPATRSTASPLPPPCSALSPPPPLHYRSANSAPSAAPPTRARRVRAAGPGAAAGPAAGAEDAGRAHGGAQAAAPGCARGCPAGWSALGQLESAPGRRPLAWQTTPLPACCCATDPAEIAKMDRDSQNLQQAAYKTQVEVMVGGLNWSGRSRWGRGRGRGALLPAPGS
jgi:hypothetical protein